MKTLHWLLASTALATSLFASAQESAIRKTLAERIPQLEKIDEVQSTPMPGLYEVRIGTDVFYTDAKGNYLIQGELIDTKARRNLTEDRIAKLSAVDFSALPLADAFTAIDDNDGARTLIEEVIAEASGETKARADAKAKGIEFITADASFTAALKKFAQPLETAWLADAEKLGVDGKAALAFYKQQAAETAK